MKVAARRRQQRFQSRAIFYQCCIRRFLAPANLSQQRQDSGDTQAKQRVYGQRTPKHKTIKTAAKV
jgi:hypothetical protein